MLRISPRSFGYADDAANMNSGADIAGAAEAAQATLDKILQWGRENAVSFSPDKTELVYFSQGVLPTNSSNHRLANPVGQPAPSNQPILEFQFGQPTNLSLRLVGWVGNPSNLSSNI